MPTKTTLPPKRITETSPQIGNVTFAFHRSQDDLPRKRKDIWFKGEVFINGIKLPYVLHLFSCDGSIKGTKNKFNCSIAINEENVNGFKRCPYCSGNKGVSSPTTKGLTAAALSPVLFPLVEKEGYSIYYCNHASGGWFLFDMHCEGQERSDVPDRGFYRTPNYYSSWVDEINCPIHGTFLWKEIEGCDLG